MDVFLVDWIDQKVVMIVGEAVPNCFIRVRLFASITKSEAAGGL